MEYTKLHKIWRFFVDNIKFILLLLCVFLLLLNCNTCSKLRTEKNENAILNNNILAMNDTLKNYSENGYNIAEMRALQLRVDELTDSLKLERGKTPVTIVQYIANVNDTFTMNTLVVRDTCYIDNNIFASDAGTIKSIEHSYFGRSSRYVEINTPYAVNCNDGKLYADGESEVTMQQNIWTENVLFKDKDGYTYLRLKTDYPGVTFNSGNAMLVLDPAEEKKLRKQFALGIGVQIGYGIATHNTIHMSPYIGIGIGLHWNPKFLQF